MLDDLTILNVDQDLFKIFLDLNVQFCIKIFINVMGKRTCEFGVLPTEYLEWQILTFIRVSGDFADSSLNFLRVFFRVVAEFIANYSYDLKAILAWELLSKIVQNLHLKLASFVSIFDGYVHHEKCLCVASYQFQGTV